MRRKLVVGNWKMHGSIATNKVLLEGIVAGVKDLREVDAVVCAPYPYLCQAQSLLAGSNVAWGAQNMCSNNDGAITGAVSPAMLVD